MRTPPILPKRVDGGAHKARDLIVVGLSKSTLADRESRWKAWMQESQEGNEKSYALLLGELAKAAASYAQIRQSDPDLCADFSQEVMIAVHRARHTFRSEKMFSPWFFAIVRNRFIDTLRAARRSPIFMDSEAVVNQLIARDPEWATMDAMREAIARLPAVQQKAIHLRMDGRSIQEMAVEMNLGISAAKVTVHRARKALEKILRQDYEFD